MYKHAEEDIRPIVSGHRHQEKVPAPSLTRLRSTAPVPPLPRAPLTLCRSVRVHDAGQQVEICLGGGEAAADIRAARTEVEAGRIVSLL